MANPVKAGDAKPWVYSHQAQHGDQDCQVTEDDETVGLTARHAQSIALPRVPTLGALFKEKT